MHHHARVAIAKYHRLVAGELPEYYPTRVEMAIMRDNVEAIARALSVAQYRRRSRRFRARAVRHKVFYDEAKGRIEMHLESLCEETVHVDGKAFEFRASETIHIENSCKYTVDEFRSMGRAAGFKPEKIWIDQDLMFGVHAMTGA